ncbi:thioredoxin family protein [Geofilum rubicundum]|uniref:Thioredoxin n=1 Tax=Geofilum rubicundum JCM 15548 TaxID=1236989 RepID=A0A0E9LTJ0_9BACT|nr:thioredoxin family protein [Geofilum rubicundum]GAO28180.1 thioredoxin [Geofilum rubicundum JCM 15548]
MENVASTERFEAIIRQEAAVLAYFSHEQCNVCKVLKPKVEALLADQFPKIKALYCDTKNAPEIAASQSVFAVPTIIVWFEGKETYRFSRNIGLQELEGALSRPYHLFFD